MPLQVLSVKVQPDVLKQFREAQGNSEAMTGNQFVEELLESYLNPKTKTVEVPTPTDQQAAEIQSAIAKVTIEKDNEIGRIKTDLSLKLDRIAELEKQLREAQERKPEIKLEPIQPAENEILISLPPVVKIVLDKERAIAKQKSGKEFSRQDILLNTFWDGVTNGAAYPFKIWTANDLKKIADSIKPDK